MFVTEFVGLLNSLGLNPQTLTPLGIVSVIAYLVFSKKVNTKLNKLNNSHLTPIKLAITEMQTHMRIGGTDIQHNLTEVANSPIQPTKFGQELLKKSGLEEFIKTKKTILIKKLDVKLTKDSKAYTDYDVQEQSINLMIELKDTSLLNNVKNYAFENGIRVEILLRLGGFMLRDIFLKNKNKK